MPPVFQKNDDEDWVDCVPRWLRAMVAATDRSPEEIQEDEEAGWPRGFDSMIFGGVKDIRAEKGRVVCTVPVTKNMLNRYGTLHGGCIATMVDVFTTAALWTVSGPPGGVSVDLSVSYMASAKAQEEVEVEARVLKTGRSLAVATATVRRKKDGLLLAEGRHTKFVASSPSSKL